MNIGKLNWDKTSPLIMGIINITPDSFSDGGQFLSVDAALKHAEGLISQGADILDVGAESSRPGATKVSVEEELKRLTPFLKTYSKHFDTPLSLDTYKSEVAEFGGTQGVSMINDISGLTGDPNMAKIVAKLQLPLCIMHRQDSPEYKDVVEDVFSFLEAHKKCAKKAGVSDVIVDPGIGFGKLLSHNLALLNNLQRFCELGPVLIGTSKKSFIGDITGDPTHKRQEGTLASNVVAFQKGARIFRIHDVHSIKKVLEITKAILGG
jgi:dihydropteroate synthase